MTERQKHIKKLLKQLDLTEAWLAKRLNMKPQTLNYSLNKSIEIKEDDYLNMLKALPDIEYLQENIKDLKQQHKYLYRQICNTKIRVLLSWETLMTCQFMFEEEMKKDEKLHGGKIDYKKLSEEDMAMIPKRALDEIKKALKEFD